MDITSLFKGCVDTLRQQNKELGFLNSSDGLKVASSSAGKSKIFPSKKSEYFNKARELSTTITSLRDFLQENRNAYLNIGASRSFTNNSVFANANSSGKKAIPTMSDMERDQIDNDVQKIVQNCQKRILEYESVLEITESIRSNPHLRTHLESIADSLSVYLKAVTTLFSEMRAIRVKRTVDYQTMSRLSSVSSLSFKKRYSSDSTVSSKNNNGFVSQERRSLNMTESEVDGHPPGSSSSLSVPSYFLDEEIPPEELQLLEEENAALLNELNSLSNEVDQIQSNVVQIAQLQEIFTEKVLQQEKEIDKISNVVVGTTENIKGGNEQIRQAIQKNADFRVWVLFFILVMSFSLLFLDWYNE